MYLQNYIYDYSFLIQTSWNFLNQTKSDSVNTSIQYGLLSTCQCKADYEKHCDAQDRSF